MALQGIDLGGEPLGADRFGVAIQRFSELQAALVHADQLGRELKVEVGRCDIEIGAAFLLDQALLAGIELVSAAIGQWATPEIEDVVVEPQADVAKQVLQQQIAVVAQINIEIANGLGIGDKANGAAHLGVAAQCQGIELG